MLTSRLWQSAAIAFVLLVSASRARADIVVLNETFANDSGFTKAEDDGTAAEFFTNGSDEYWGINDPVGTTDDYDGDPVAAGVPAYTGFSGNFLNGENLDVDADHTQPLMLTWSNLNISGLANLLFSGLFAAATDQFENDLTGDYIRVQYRIDSDVAAFTELLWFSGDGGTGSDDLAVDAGFDGTGEGTHLSLASASFSAAISGTGSTLDLRILMSANANSEAIAFDTIAVASVPELSPFIFGGAICAIAGLWSLRQGRRRAEAKI